MNQSIQELKTTFKKIFFCSILKYIVPYKILPLLNLWKFKFNQDFYSPCNVLVLVSAQYNDICKTWNKLVAINQPISETLLFWNCRHQIDDWTNCNFTHSLYSAKKITKVCPDLFFHTRTVSILKSHITENFAYFKRAPSEESIIL